MNKPLIEIETKIAFLDDSIHCINKTLYKQQQQIDTIEKKLDVLTQMFREIRDSVSDISNGDEKPPHY